MRIDQLSVQNFKKFATQTFLLHPHFTLLVGENGSGKTSVLDALAVSMGVWLVETPDTSLQNSRRNILPTEIRLEPSVKGDRIQFQEKLPVLVQATGQIGDQQDVTWVRQIKAGGKRTTNNDAKAALDIIGDIYRRDAAGESIICPVLAYYGAGRAWLPSNQRLPAEVKSNGPARRWAAFYDCFNERIRFDELRTWFHRETTAAGNRGGRMRPGFEVVRRAVMGCVPNADRLWFDPDREQIVLSIAGHAQPFDNLSAGQRMMLALVADIAPPGLRGAAFGLRQSLDTVGAFLGPTIATLLMMLWANDFRAVFWAACLPAGLCVLLLVFGVKEPERSASRQAINPISRAALASLGRSYWWVVGLGAIFTLARFSEAFLILRAEQIGIPMALVPLVMVAMNLYIEENPPFITELTIMQAELPA